MEVENRGASADADRVLSPAATEPSCTVSAHSGDAPLRGVEGEVLRPESCDAEIAEMMAKLGRLQSWLILQSCKHNGDPAFIAAGTLIQDVRVLLVERCFK